MTTGDSRRIYWKEERFIGVRSQGGGDEFMAQWYEKRFLDESKSKV